MVERVAPLLPLIGIQAALFLATVVKQPKVAVLESARTGLLCVSYALMVPVIRYVFLFVGLTKLYFLACVFALIYLITYNYDYFLVHKVSDNNQFNIDKANVFTTYLSFLFVRSMDVDRAVQLLMVSNV